MIENLIVGVIVAFAVLHTAAKYLPVSWRQRLLALLARQGAAPTTLARWLGSKASCGSGCDSCKACAEPAEAAQAPAGRRVITLHQRH